MKSEKPRHTIVKLVSDPYKEITISTDMVLSEFYSSERKLYTIKNLQDANYYGWIYGDTYQYFERVAGVYIIVVFFENDPLYCLVNYLNTLKSITRDNAKILDKLSVVLKKHINFE